MTKLRSNHRGSQARGVPAGRYLMSFIIGICCSLLAVVGLFAQPAFEVGLNDVRISFLGADGSFATLPSSSSPVVVVEPGARTGFVFWKGDTNGFSEISVQRVDLSLGALMGPANTVSTFSSLPGERSDSPAVACDWEARRCLVVWTDDSQMVLPRVHGQFFGRQTIPMFLYRVTNLKSFCKPFDQTAESTPRAHCA